MGLTRYAEDPAQHQAAVVEDEVELYTMFVLVEEEEAILWEEAEPVTFLSEEDQEEEEELLVECDAHSVSLDVKDVVNSVEYLRMQEAMGRFLEFVNKIDLCLASHQVELE